MRHRFLLLLLCAGLSLGARALSAQSGLASLRQLKARTDTLLTPPAAGAAGAASRVYLSEDQLRYNHAYWQYQTDAISHRHKVYNWQYRSSIGIFSMVVFIVLSGIGFSGMQFYIAAKSAQINASAISSNIEVSPEGVKITSSVLGVIILTLSIVFFFLYLKYVYPISESPNLVLQTRAADPAPARSN